MVAGNEYVPGRGDVLWLTFNPQAGHEQAGRRPAVAVSPRSYNEKTGLGIFCPVTSQVTGYPFEVLLPQGFAVAGVVLSDQAKSLDWRARRAELISPLPSEKVNEVLRKLATLVSLS